MRSATGLIPPHTQILGPFMGDVLRMAATAIRSQCANTEQAATFLRDLAAEYEAVDRARGS